MSTIKGNNLQNLSGSSIAVSDLIDLKATAIVDSDVGVANGIAPLGSDGKVPAANLPTTGSTGLVNFTEGVNSAAPNATIPVVSLVPNNAATNVDVVISVKGTGSLSSTIADNGLGGNKRGNYAIDLQLYRSAPSPTTVASGNYSVIVGGKLHTASGISSGVFGGDNNKSTGNYSVTLGGVACETTGTYSTMVGGYYAAASGLNAITLGGYYTNDRGSYGALTRGYTSFSSTRQGMTQVRYQHQTIKNTAGASANLSANGTSITAPYQCVLPNNSAYAITATVVGIDASGNTAMFFITMLAKRLASAATTVIVGTPTVTAYKDTAATSGNWNVTPTVNTTLGGIQFVVIADTQVQWSADIKTVETQIQ